MDMLTLITYNKITYQPVSEHFDISCLKIDVEESSDKREYTCLVSNFVTFPFQKDLYNHCFKIFKYFKYLVEIYMHRIIEDKEVEKEL